MADDLARAEAAEAPAGREVPTVRQAEEEAAGVEIAGAGRVDDSCDLARLDDMGMRARDDNRAMLAAGQRGDLAQPAHGGDRRIPLRRLEHRAELGLVGEEDIDVLLEK